LAAEDEVEGRTVHLESPARFLLQIGDKRRFGHFHRGLLLAIVRPQFQQHVKAGLQTKNWPTTTDKSVRSVREMNEKWEKAPNAEEGVA